MDTLFGDTRMQLMQRYGTPRHTIAPLIGSHKIISPVKGMFEMFPERYSTNTVFTWQIAKWNAKQSKFLSITIDLPN